VAHRVAKWFNPKYWTPAVSLVQIVLAILSGIIIIFMPDKRVKIPYSWVIYRTPGTPSGTI